MKIDSDSIQKDAERSVLQPVRCTRAW